MSLLHGSCILSELCHQKRGAWFVGFGDMQVSEPTLQIIKGRKSIPQSVNKLFLIAGHYKMQGLVPVVYTT